MSEKEPFLTFSPLDNEQLRDLEEGDPRSYAAYEAFAARELYRIAAEKKRSDEEHQIDPRTGAYTYEAFCEKLNAMLETLYTAESRRAADIQAVIVFFIDLWEFKGINEAYGRPVADASLRRVVALLQEALRREGDMTGRFGGDEFMVGVPVYGPGSAEEVAISIHERIDDIFTTYNREKSVKDPQLELTIGYSIVQSDTPDATAEEVINQASVIEHEEKIRERARRGVKRRQE